MTWHDVKLAAGIFLAGLVVGMYLVLGQGGALGSRLQLAGARLIAAGSPTYVSADMDGGTVSTAFSEPYVAAPAKAQKAKHR